MVIIKCTHEEEKPSRKNPDDLLHINRRGSPRCPGMSQAIDGKSAHPQDQQDDQEKPQIETVDETPVDHPFPFPPIASACCSGTFRYSSIILLARGAAALPPCPPFSTRTATAIWG